MRLPPRKRWVYAVVALAYVALAQLSWLAGMRLAEALRGAGIEFLLVAMFGGVALAAFVFGSLACAAIAAWWSITGERG